MLWPTIYGVINVILMKILVLHLHTCPTLVATKVAILGFQVRYVYPKPRRDLKQTPRNLVQLVNIDYDDVNHVNMRYRCWFQITSNKTSNPYIYGIQYPNDMFFSALESS